ncbi:MAG: SCO family protein, partial [Shewanella sp.]
VEVLQQYAQKNHIDAAKWLLVTGDREQIYSLAKKAYFANEDLGEYVSKEDFLHTENLVLVDKNRHIRGIYNGLNNTSVANLITDIKSLMSE